MNKTIQLTVNGRAERGNVEPRLQLADFLREHLGLTGTHLGCEHGVCGACTVDIDGAPARSCIAYAVACDGSSVRTIEGFDDDPVMTDLREAFSAEHALQCGYCTPGMLVTARDIVLRLPHADEARIRKELSGNLCRCTGYVGIVRAIQRVLAKRNADGVALAVRPERTPVFQSVRPEPFDKLRTGFATATQSKEEQPAHTLHQTFSVEHPRDQVWAFFGRLEDVTPCLPGASVIGTPTADHADIRLRVKLGPIAPEFEGGADVTRDASSYSGTIRGAARDTRSNSATRGEVRYVLIEEKQGAATRAEVDVSYTLTGPLAQFSRSSIVQDIARRMSAAFARNLEAQLNHSESGKRPVAELDAGSLFFSAAWARIRRFIRTLLGG
jgi:carbon-monoxide dehydrogenase small subunit